jgi:hypothetical protein
MQFSRFTETIQLKSNKHVAGVTVRLLIADCTGIIYFTDMQLQDGDQLTGYTVHTSKMLTKMQENGQPVPPRHYNGVVRTAETVVNAGDELTLKASTRQCLKNGSQTPKDGFYQYSAAWDSKHTVKLEERKSARLLFEFQEMQEGGDRL